MAAGMREKRNKFTASVRDGLVERLDEKVAELKVTRSAAVEQAIELWLAKLTEQEEEAYFAACAKEMNDDARTWNATTTQSARNNW
jgi:metal-responsive CopG/Arc/MetJ family transcriptional regulator